MIPMSEEIKFVLEMLPGVGRMLYEQAPDCPKSDFGHDARVVKGGTVRINEDGDEIYLQVVCNNCGMKMWERFESIEWLVEK